MSKKDHRGPTDGIESESGAGVAAESELKPKKPNMYKVLLHNDDYTTMEFVVHVLVVVFHHKTEMAVEIMLNVHHQGMGVAGIYPFAVAETKVKKVHELARENEYPLRCSLEPS